MSIGDLWIGYDSITKFERILQGFCCNGKSLQVVALDHSLPKKVTRRFSHLLS